MEKYTSAAPGCFGCNFYPQLKDLFSKRRSSSMPGMNGLPRHAVLFIVGSPSESSNVSTSYKSLQVWARRAKNDYPSVTIMTRDFRARELVEKPTGMREASENLENSVVDQILYQQEKGRVRQPHFIFVGHGIGCSVVRTMLLREKNIRPFPNSCEVWFLEDPLPYPQQTKQDRKYTSTCSTNSSALSFLDHGRAHVNDGNIFEKLSTRIDSEFRPTKVQIPKSTTHVLKGLQRSQLDSTILPSQNAVSVSDEIKRTSSSNPMVSSSRMLRVTRFVRNRFHTTASYISSWKHGDSAKEAELDLVLMHIERSMMSGRLEEAESRLDKADSHQGTAPAAFVTRIRLLQGISHTFSGRYRQAIDGLNQLSLQEGELGSLARGWLGYTYILHGHYECAVQCLEGQLERDEDDLSPHLAVKIRQDLALAHAHLTNDKISQYYLRDAHEIRRGLKEARKGVELPTHNLSPSSSPLQFINEEQPHTSEARGLEVEASISILRGDYNEALHTIDAAIKILKQVCYPSHPTLLSTSILRSWLLVVMSKETEAESFIESLRFAMKIAFKPHHLQHLQLRGVWHYLHQNRHNPQLNSDTDCTTINTQYPDNLESLEAHIRLAIHRRSAGQYASAEKGLRNGIKQWLDQRQKMYPKEKLRPVVLRALTELARVYTCSGAFSAAEKLISGVLDVQCAIRDEVWKVESLHQLNSSLASLALEDLEDLENGYISVSRDRIVTIMSRVHYESRLITMMDTLEGFHVKGTDDHSTFCSSVLDKARSFLIDSGQDEGISYLEDLVAEEAACAGHDNFKVRILQVVRVAMSRIHVNIDVLESLRCLSTILFERPSSDEGLGREVLKICRNLSNRMLGSYHRASLNIALQLEAAQPPLAFAVISSISKVHDDCKETYGEYDPDTLHALEKQIGVLLRAVLDHERVSWVGATEEQLHAIRQTSAEGDCAELLETAEWIWRHRAECIGKFGPQTLATLKWLLESLQLVGKSWETIEPYVKQLQEGIRRIEGERAYESMMLGLFLAELYKSYMRTDLPEYLGTNKVLFEGSDCEGFVYFLS